MNEDIIIYLNRKLMELECEKDLFKKWYEECKVEKETLKTKLECEKDE